MPLHMRAVLINRGRGRAVVKGITIQVYRSYPCNEESQVWFTDLEVVPDSAGRVPPFELPGLDSVEWDWEIDGKLLQQGIRERRFSTIVPTVELGDRSKVIAKPVFVLSEDDQSVSKWIASAYPVRRRDRTGLLD